VSYLNTAATGIGWVVLGVVFLLVMLTLASAIHEGLRSLSTRYDRYWYDETGRRNRELMRRERRQRWISRMFRGGPKGMEAPAE